LPAHPPPAACELTLECGVVSAPIVMNELRRLIAIGTASMPAMSFDTRPALAPGGGGGVVIQGDTITITIQAAPGMDEQAIARAVEAVLDRRERDKAARFPSSLYDRS